MAPMKINICQTQKVELFGITVTVQGKSTLTLTFGEGNIIDAKRIVCEVVSQELSVHQR